MKIDLSPAASLKPLRPQKNSPEQQLEQAKEVQDKFRSVMGELFFGQLMKSMRSTQGKPAYFHGGRAEEIFQGQLDQIFAKEIADASADQIIDPMFRQKFPQAAELLKLEAENKQMSVDDLQQLRRF